MRMFINYFSFDFLGDIMEFKLNKINIFLIVLLISVINFGFVLAVIPSGGTITSISNSTAPLDVAQGVAAIAGNVTEINIVGFSTTQSWQGYFGNVSGTLQLADGSDNVMYNWSLASPEGEIYASVNNSVNWVGTQCYNNTTFTSNLELEYNILSNDVDGIDETFNMQDHDAFYVNNILINTNTCMSTRVYGDTGAGVNEEFEEVLLTGGSNEVIFASLLEEDILGFDDRSHDFEMLVLEDGHGTDTATRPYYFYVELQ